MALSDKWTQAQLRTLCQEELMDPSAVWFGTGEINQYIGEWQQRLQDYFGGNELVWNTSTLTLTNTIGTMTDSFGILIPTGVQNIVLNTFVPSQVRIDAFYWISSTAGTNSNGVRMVARTRQDLNILIRDWETVLPTDPPLVIYQDDIRSINLWPGNALVGTLIAEFPALTTFATDSSTMQVPAWMRYSVKHYVCYRCYLRTGPRQDINKAAYYKKQWLAKLMRYRRMWDNYFPYRYLSLKPKQPSDAYNISILNPPYITIIPP